ncbi:ABC transporter ATP-binding protein [Duncaniella muricolitica]|jgi:ABC-2 type transport system ATP-binding protein|uniref:ABC transporter ATP-binding protein n=1 Tax=Duncaniella muricolitica TaxID=2880704 RepID=UPI00244DFF6F|nr:ABC transporter ATP-binding protein [Duncaniella muricolitica]
MDILSVENVSKAYSSHLALDDVSLSIPEGTVYGLLGPNGAGKTTLIRIINHITAPDSGRVLLDGHQLSEADVPNIGYLPEERGLYKKMKVGEQAVFFARLKGLSRADATRELRKWFEKFDILNWWDKRVEELSKGMAQKVQFIVTVLHRPRLLIFDEPFSGFDPINAELLKREILALRDEGATIIFSTHNMSSVEEICDNITLINKSRNILSGNVEELRRKYFDGRYDITLSDGDPAVLTEALAPVADSFMTLDPDTQGRQRLSLHISGNASLRDVIAIANPIVSLAGLQESRASMNDIFIRTVNGDRF